MRPRCRRHDKVVFPSQRIALAAVEEAVEVWERAVSAGRVEVPLPPVTVYPCGAGPGWHWSTRVRKNWVSPARSKANRRRGWSR